MNAKIEIISNNIEATISSDIILDRHTQVSVASEIDVLKTYVKELEKSIQYQERKQKKIQQKETTLTLLKIFLLKLAGENLLKQFYQM